MKYRLTFCILLLLFVAGSMSLIMAQTPQWITASESQSETNTWLGFKKDFVVSSVPQVLKARIAVDSKYWLWLNDKLIVFEGGVKRGPNRNDTYFDSIDLAPYLKQGDNTIAVLVWYFGKQGFSHNPSGQVALFFDAESPELSLVSDETWTAFVHPAYYTPLGEKPNFRLPESNIGFDANKDIEEWFLLKDKRTFQPAKVLGTEGCAPWNRLHPRIIPLWKDYGYADYRSVIRRQGSKCDTLICELPYNAQITPYFKVNAHKGDIISIKTDHYYGGGPANVRAEYIAKDGIQEYESFGWMNGHKVIYIVPQRAEIIELKYRETSYNTDFAGSFKCNDEFFNRFWEKARRTLLVTMRDTYMDCPDRERSQWWGDAVNESGETFYALCPQSHLLTKKGMYELIGWQQEDGTLYSPIPSSNWNKELPGQMLASIGYYGFWNYYLHTGDLQTIKNLYGGVNKYLNIWEKNPDGTVKVRQTAWVWGDWGTNIDKEALFNAWYYIALKGAQKMAVALGYEKDGTSLSNQMAEFKQAYNEKFWNGKVYRSPSYTEDTDDRVHALAVVSGLADSKQFPSIFKVFQTKEYASPYMEKYVTEALFLMGKGEYGLQRMKKRFKEMVEDPQCSTLYEGWGIGENGYGGGSSNHAWSGGGLTVLAQYVCGVLPIESGYSKFMVKPIFAGLNNVALTMECVKGKIKVSWEKNKQNLVLKISVPLNTQGLIVVPKNKIKLITCNGKDVWTKYGVSNASEIRCLGVHDENIEFLVNGGDYLFNCSE